MEKVAILPNVVILIAAAVFVVILFKRLRLSPVLGYFVAGAIIGENGFKIITHEDTYVLAEFGVVFLLFAIGLELSIERLKAMRKYVFGFGTMQVVISAFVIASIALLFNLEGDIALIIGGGLALSSTAIVLQVTAENRSQSTQVGRIALANLLLQDFAVVPLLVIIPLLAGDGRAIMNAVSLAMLKAVLALIVIFIMGRLLLRPLFNMITDDNMAKSHELFIGATLLIALSAAWSTEYMGLSLALGAFVAGILVAETEFQVRAEESIAPFKGLLLGLFFMSVGMRIDIYEVYAHLGLILFLSATLIIVKALIIIGLCMLFGFHKGTAIHAGLLLSQGGEFAFILFGLGLKNDLLPQFTHDILLLVVALTMALTPLLAILGEKAANKLNTKLDKYPTDIIKLGARDLMNHVIVAGFGRVGKMVARILEAENINYIALDINDEIVKDAKSSGFPAFRGDISQLQALQAAGADRAVSIILAIDNEVTAKKSLKIISTNFPELAVVVRTHDLKNAEKLYTAGATMIVPEDYETGLQLGGAVLKSVGISEFEISRIKNQFRAGNYIIAKQDDEIYI